MVPSHLVELGELPLNASRKIDRRALRDGPLPAAPQGSPPATAEERRVVRVWEDVLGQAPIGRDQSFYDLGGTSLQAVRIEKRDRAELRSLFTTMTAVMPVRLRGRPALDDLLARTGDQLMASYERTDHLMRRPTLWNDSWAAAPRLLRRLVAWLTARHELLTPYVFAIVPFPRRRRGRDREILIAVNILPEVYHTEPAAPDEVRVERNRTIELILRPGDLIINSDAMLDRTLQIHVTREDDRIVLNLYGGGIDQAGLDEIARAIAGTLERLAAPSTMAVGA
jgi:hypothetical protein